MGLKCDRKTAKVSKKYYMDDSVYKFRTGSLDHMRRGFNVVLCILYYKKSSE